MARNIVISLFYTDHFELGIKWLMNNIAEYVTMLGTGT